MDPRQRLMMQLQHADEINWGSGKQPIPIKPTDFSNNRSESMPWGVDIPRPVNDRPLEPEDPIGTTLTIAPVLGQLAGSGLRAAMQFSGRQGSRAGLGMQRAMTELGEGMENSELQSLHASRMRPDPFTSGAKVGPYTHLENGQAISNNTLALTPHPQWQAFGERVAKMHPPPPARVPIGPGDFAISGDRLANMGDKTANEILRGGKLGPVTNSLRGPLAKAPPPPSGLGPSTGSRWDALEQHLNAGIADKSLVSSAPESAWWTAGQKTDPIGQAFQSRVKTVIDPGVPTITLRR